MTKPLKISRAEPYLRTIPEWFRSAPAQRWLIDLVGERDLVPVACVYLHDPNTEVHYLADQITGSLYNPETMACLSSSALRLIKPVHSVARQRKAPFKPVPMRVIA